MWDILAQRFDDMDSQVAVAVHPCLTMLLLEAVMTVLLLGVCKQ
jgi:hypothetical protein